MTMESPHSRLPARLPQKRQMRLSRMQLPAGRHWGNSSGKHRQPSWHSKQRLAVASLVAQKTPARLPQGRQLWLSRRSAASLKPQKHPARLPQGRQLRLRRRQLPAGWRWGESSGRHRQPDWHGRQQPAAGLMSQGGTVRRWRCLSSSVPGGQRMSGSARQIGLRMMGLSLKRRSKLLTVSTSCIVPSSTSRQGCLRHGRACYGL